MNTNIFILLLTTIFTLILLGKTSYASFIAIISGLIFTIISTKILGIFLLVTGIMLLPSHYKKIIKDNQEKLAAHTKELGNKASPTQAATSILKEVKVNLIHINSLVITKINTTTKIIKRIFLYTIFIAATGIAAIGLNNVTTKESSGSLMTAARAARTAAGIIFKPVSIIIKLIRKKSDK